MIEELLGGAGSKLGAPIGGEFFDDAICHENSAKTSDEASSSVTRHFHNRPIAVPDNSHYIVLALECEVVSGYTLEGVDG